MRGVPRARERERDSNSPSPQNSPKRSTMAPKRETDSEKIDRLLSSVAVIADSIGNLNAKISALEASSGEMMKKLEERENKWGAEREQLLKKNKELEGRLNQLERRERQNRAIVRGVPNVNKTNALAEINKLLGQLDEPVVPQSVDTLRESTDQRGALVLVTFRSRAEKSAVFKQRKELRCGDTKVYIDDDYAPGAGN